MKTTDWYSRLLLTLITGLLLVMATELHTANRRSAALGNATTGAARSAAVSGPRTTPVGLWKPATRALLPPDNVLNVRIVGYRYTPQPAAGQPTVTQDVSFGIYSTPGLPVITR